MKSQDLCHRLKKYREAKGLKVREVAALLGVSVSTYRDWEYGRSIKGEPYEKLAEIYGVSVHQLLTGYQASPKAILGKIEKLEADLKFLKRELESFFWKG
ncbi:MAG: helix-turn-helix transcriptional regulator [Bdellovibrionaceae bacterium]|nr:helix-turn-helix transcriptional regulator [Pseudobdellovibrionaceae bacterium]